MKRKVRINSVNINQKRYYKNLLTTFYLQIKISNQAIKKNRVILDKLKTQNLKNFNRKVYKSSTYSTYNKSSMLNSSKFDNKSENYYANLFNNIC